MFNESTDFDEDLFPNLSEDKYELEASAVGAPQGVPQPTIIEKVVEQPVAVSEQIVKKQLVNSDHEKVVNAFGKLMDRAATEDERSRLLKMQYELDLKPSDTMWSMLLQFESYNSLFNAVPARISNVVDDCIEKIQHATNEEIKRVNIDIQRKERELDHDVDKAGFELSHKINELIEKVFADEKITVEKEVQRQYNLRSWTLLLLVGITQCLIIAVTNSITYSLAKGSSVMPWFELSENSSVPAWLFQAIWNFPSGWVITFMLFFSAGFYLWYDHLKKM